MIIQNHFQFLRPYISYENLFPGKERLQDVSAFLCQQKWGKGLSHFLILNDKMKSKFIDLYFIIGILFGFIGGLMAFLISYRELIRHFPDKSKRPLEISIKSALVTFLFFFALSFVIGIIFSNMLNN